MHHSQRVCNVNGQKEQLWFDPAIPVGTLQELIPEECIVIWRFHMVSASEACGKNGNGEFPAGLTK